MTSTSTSGVAGSGASNYISSGAQQAAHCQERFIPSLVQVFVGCCVLASCSVTLGGAPVTLLCCLVYG